jgi:hypothetical protein
VEQLVAIIGEPAERARRKVRPSLDEADRAWLARSPLCLLATADAAGRCDVSPKPDVVDEVSEPSATVARAPTSAQRRIRCTSGKDSKGYAVAAGKGRKLVIVESPAKAKKIAEYLGGDFEVEASVGHIRDLPNPRDLPADSRRARSASSPSTSTTASSPTTSSTPTRSKKVADLKRLVKDAPSSTSPPMRTARARRSPGTCWRPCSRESR